MKCVLRSSVVTEIFVVAFVVSKNVLVVLVSVDRENYGLGTSWQDWESHGCSSLLSNN